MSAPDHGGGLDRAIGRFGGRRGDWLDLSTGINPQAYPLPAFCPADWLDLPDRDANAKLLNAARAFWRVPGGVGVLAAAGASALIAAIPGLQSPGTVRITAPTYNEHAAAFRAHGWDVTQGPAPVRVIVHPNNPTGALWQAEGDYRLLVIDESFCETCPEASLIALAQQPNVVILKSFGKFWGLAGLRLGFAIGTPETLAPLRARIGPWAVSGPALRLGALALSDKNWAAASRRRLAQEAARLDRMLEQAGATVIGGTDLFRLAAFADAGALYSHLAARHRILTRLFPYSKSWLRFGLPGTEAGWRRLQTALSTVS